MFSVKNFQDKLKSNFPANGNAQSEVESGFICPNCHANFVEVDQLINHVPTCTSDSNGNPPDQSSNVPKTSAAESKLSKMAQDNARLQQACDDMTSKIDHLNQQLQKNSVLLETKLTYIDQLQTQILEYEERNDDADAVRQELTSLQTLITSISNENSMNSVTQQLEVANSKNDSLLEEIDNLKSKLSEKVLVNENAPDAQVSSDDREPSTDLDKEEYDKLERENQEMKQSLADKDKELSSRNSSILCLQQQVEQLQAIVDRGCKQCKDYEKKIQSMQKQSSSSNEMLKVELETLQSSLAKEKAKVATLERKSALDNKRIAQSKIDCEAINSKLSSLENSLAAAENDKSQLTAEVAKLKSFKDVNTELTSQLEFEKSKNDELSKLNEECQIRLVEVLRHNESLTAEKDSIQSKLANADGEKEKMVSELNIKIERLKNEQVILTENVNKLKLHNLESDEKHSQQTSILNKNLASARKELINQQKSMAALEQESGAMKKSLEVSMSSIESLETAKSELTEKLHEKSNEFDRLKTHYLEVRRQLDDCQRVMFELGREQQSLQVEKAKIFDRVWVDDKDVNFCEKCHKEFTATLRKHHCRSCGLIFCNDCSMHRAKLPAHPQPVRVCDKCNDHLPNS